MSSSTFCHNQQICIDKGRSTGWPLLKAVAGANLPYCLQGALSPVLLDPAICYGACMTWAPKEADQCLKTFDLDLWAQIPIPKLGNFLS